MASLRAFFSNALTDFDSPSRFRRNLLIVLAITVAAHGAVLIRFWPDWEWHTGSTPDAWNLLAINLVDHSTFGFAPGEPTVARGPIFPLFEVPLYLSFGTYYPAWSGALLMFNVLTTILIVYSFRLIWGHRAALIAGLYYGINIPIIYYTAKISQLTSVMPFVTIWLVLMALWDKRIDSKMLPVVLGLLTGIMILNKTVYLPLPAAGILILLWGKRKDGLFARHIIRCFVFLAVSIIVVLPWTFRNYRVTHGRFVPVQSMFWELFVQDVLYSDLQKSDRGARPDGDLLRYFINQEKSMLVAQGVPVDSPSPLMRAAWEVDCERAYRAVALKWLKSDPWRIMQIKLKNLWYFWIRAENERKTSLMTGMQIFYLGSAAVSLIILGRAGLMSEVKYPLLLILVLWAEHCPVFAWGRFSLDLVPALAVIVGIGLNQAISRRFPHSSGANSPA